MKHLFLSLFLMAFVFTATAQSPALFKFSGDTVVNTGTINLEFTANNACEYLTIQLVNTKLSGTVAGKTYLQGTLDGTNYTKLDSITNLNVTTNSFFFNLTGCKYSKYRLTSTGSGTMAYRTRGYALARRRS